MKDSKWIKRLRPLDDRVPTHNVVQLSAATYNAMVRHLKKTKAGRRVLLARLKP